MLVEQACPIALPLLVDVVSPALVRYGCREQNQRGHRGKIPYEATGSAWWKVFGNLKRHDQVKSMIERDGRLEVAGLELNQGR